MLGEKIKNLRITKNKTQKELAEGIGVDQRTISNWEIERSEPSTDMIKKISDYFNVKMTYFYEGYVEPDQDPVRELIDKLVKEGYIKDPDHISDQVAKMIIDAVRMDLRMKQLKQG